MFDHVISKFKENENIVDGKSCYLLSKPKFSKNLFCLSKAEFRGFFGCKVNVGKGSKAMETREWELNDIEKKIEKDDLNFAEKLNLKIEDNYIYDKNFYAFPAVSNFLACNFDYYDRDISKVDSIEKLKDKLKNDYDVSLLAGLDQRIHNISSQHPNPQYLTP